MKESRLPTLQEIDDLIAFLSRLYSDGFTPVERWNGGKQKDGSFTLAYPSYDPVVEEFFRCAARECWLDYGYNP
jgi:hypothetical protein